MRKTIIICLLIPIFSFSQEENKIKSIYSNMIGDIEYNKDIDKKNFKLCYEKHIFQYFNNSNGLEYNSEKLSIEKEFYTKYKSEILTGVTGLIRIRFVVNCKGETDRFRLISSDENYSEKTFPTSITQQLLTISKNLNGWKIKTHKDKEIDYYQHLIFKIENGQLKEILP